jgi:hypothetical protein
LLNYVLVNLSQRRSAMHNLLLEDKNNDARRDDHQALPEFLKRLKAGGYKVVAMRFKAPAQTLPQYDEGLLKDAKLPTVSSRPVSSVVQTIAE